MMCNLTRLANEWLVLYILEELQNITVRDLMLILFLLDYITKKRLGKSITRTRWWKIQDSSVDLPIWNYYFERELQSLAARELIDMHTETSVKVEVEYLKRIIAQLEELKPLIHKLYKLENLLHERIALREPIKPEELDMYKYELKRILSSLISISELVGELIDAISRMPIISKVLVPIPTLRLKTVVTVTEGGRKVRREIDVSYVFSFKEVELVKHIIKTLRERYYLILSGELTRLVDNLPEVKRTPVGCAVVITSSADTELRKVSSILKKLNIEITQPVTIESLRRIIDEIQEKIKRGEVPEHPTWEHCIELENLLEFLQEIEKSYRELCSKLGIPS